jgi:ankyrin repeat protein
MSELTDAIKAGDEAKVMALIDADPALLRAAENNVTPILFAIYHGQRALAQKLTARGEVSFAEACALGDRARVEALLEGDPSLVNARSTDGFPAAGLAIFFGHSELARFLFERGADVNAAAENAQRVAPVHAAAAVQDRATMEVLLARGADVHAKQQMDYTPLHGAASRGDVEMAKLLLAHGAERDARASDGMTPADVARKYGHPDFADWIST